MNGCILYRTDVEELDRIIRALSAYSSIRAKVIGVLAPLL